MKNKGRVRLIIIYIFTFLLFMPFFIIYETRNFIAFILYQFWRAYKANRLLQAHGWAVREEFLKTSKVNYRDFARG